MIWYGAGWRSTWLKCAPVMSAAGLDVPWLFSYAYLSGGALADALAWPFARFLDSGAFTAATRGTPIDLSEYIAFCQKNTGAFQPYAALDVLGDEHATRRNLLAMRAEGLAPLPTWHIGSSKAALRTVLDESAYFAIGGMVGMPPTLRAHLLRAAWDIIAASPQPVRVHGFGMTRVADLLAYPWFSVDSSSLMAASSLGRTRTVSEGSVSTVEDGLRGAAAADRRLMNSVLSWHAVMDSVNTHWQSHRYEPGRGCVPL